MTSTRRSSGEVPGEDEAGGLEAPAQEVVDLVAMAVALVDDGLAVDLADARVVVELHRVGAEPHRAAHVGDLLLLGQEVDDRERRLGVELGRVGAVHARRRCGRTRDTAICMPRQIPRYGIPSLAGDLGREDLALDARGRRSRPG